MGGLSPARIQVLLKTLAFLAIAACHLPGAATAQTPDPNINIALPTMGGTQFWTDHRWWYGWRLQHNAVTGHWRLIDLHDIRRAWGSKEACLAELEKRAAVVEQPTEVIHYVVLVHGLMRTSDSMDPIAKALKAKAEKEPISFGYASTRTSIEDHAKALREVIENLPGKPRLSFVGHSLGNIVVRRTIAMWQADGDPHQVLPRLSSVVMLGPPNQGATIAKSLAGTGLFETVTGSSGTELGAAWDDLQKQLAIPPCPFYIVAGDVASSVVKNPLVSGPSDFVVAVDETRLPGAAQHVTVPVLHSFLMSDPKVVELTMEFLSQADAKP